MAKVKKIKFKKGHKFDIFDLFTISPSEVQTLFFEQLERKKIDIENIKVFLDSGLVDVNAKDKDGWTPFFLSIRNPEIIMLLLQNGAVPISSVDVDLEHKCPNCGSDEWGVEDYNDEVFNGISLHMKYLCCYDCDEYFTETYVKILRR